MYWIPSSLILSSNVALITSFFSSGFDPLMPESSTKSTTERTREEKVDVCGCGSGDDDAVVVVDKLRMDREAI